MKLELSIFLEEINDHEWLWQSSHSQITVLENSNVDLEKSWKSSGEMHMKSVGTLWCIMVDIPRTGISNQHELKFW